MENASQSLGDDQPLYSLDHESFVPSAKPLYFDTKKDSQSFVDQPMEKILRPSSNDSQHHATSNFNGISKVKNENSSQKQNHKSKHSSKNKKITADQDQFQEYEHVFKIIMIGSSFAGKTSLLFRFVNDSFDTGYLNTVGVDLKSVTLRIQETMARINIWDTTGQEKFKSLTKAYYRNCQGALVVFDLTKKDSFYSIESQIKEFRMNCPQEAHDNVVLVGNKVDLIDKREVTHQEAQDLCNRLNLLGYFETSASSSQNVDQLFFTVAMNAFNIEKQQGKDAMNNLLGGGVAHEKIRGRTSTHIQLESYNSPEKKKRGGCCRSK